MEHKKQGTVEGVQYLRGIAALMVVLFHAYADSAYLSPYWSIGSRGVDIFFVISGFIMAYSTDGKVGPSGERTGSFLLKRIIRVVPLYWIATLWADKYVLQTSRYRLDVVKDLFFIPHFADGSPPLYTVMTQGWTLNYEMFFYALFAGSLWFGKRRYLALIAVLCLLVVLAALRPTSAFAMFATSSVMVEFLLGIAIHSIAKRWPSSLSNASLLLVGTLAMCGFALYTENGQRGFLSGPFAAAIVWCAISLKVAGGNGAFAVLGAASYSIYLFHFAGFGVARSLLSRINFSVTDAPSKSVEVLVLTAFALAIGITIHRWVETPLTEFLRQRLERRRKTAARATPGTDPLRYRTPPVHSGR